MDITSIIAEIEIKLFQGFSTTSLSNKQWLNDICGTLVKLFKILHKNLIFDHQSKTALEGCFLCAIQIITCIENLEKVLNIEHEQGVVLSPSRQFFLDRMLWCVNRLKTFDFSDHNDIEINFVYFMDMAIEIIEPHATLYQENVNGTNVANQNAEAMVDSQKLRSIVDNLIAHALAFANVVDENDKKSVFALCQRVLRDCIDFGAECSLSQEHVRPNVKDRRFKAEILESSLLRLEKVINDCLLHLVFRVFSDVLKNPFAHLDKLKQMGNASVIAKETEKFDLLNDRLIQIGIFGVVFGNSEKSKSSIRSYLASLESLEMNLVPSLFSYCNHHSSILKNHWKNETKSLLHHIQKIIDTHAFCASLIENLSNGIDDLVVNFDKNQVNELLLQCEVFLTHLKINCDSLKIKVDTDLKKHYENVKLMLRECRAVFDLCDTIERSRIMKRMKILYATIRKLQKCLKLKQSNESQIFENFPTSLYDDISELGPRDVCPGDAAAINHEFFESFGIKPTICSVLYKSTNNKPLTGSIIPKTPQYSPRNASMCNESFRSRKKRMSLRVAMFKKQNFTENKEECIMELQQNNTMNLHITEILDQLTDLSDTLSGSSHII